MPRVCAPTEREKEDCWPAIKRDNKMEEYNTCR